MIRHLHDHNIWFLVDIVAPNSYGFIYVFFHTSWSRVRSPEHFCFATIATPTARIIRNHPYEALPKRRIDFCPIGVASADNNTIDEKLAVKEASSNQQSEHQRDLCIRLSLQQQQQQSLAPAETHEDRQYAVVYPFGLLDR